MEIYNSILYHKIITFATTISHEFASKYVNSNVYLIDFTSSLNREFIINIFHIMVKVSHVNLRVYFCIIKTRRMLFIQMILMLLKGIPTTTLRYYLFIC